jgi:hypothetical protein
MTAAELLRAYPTCRVAVAWCELHVFDEFALPGTGPAFGADVRRLIDLGVSLDELIGLFVETIDETLADPATVNPDRQRLAKGQMQTPEFRAYLAGRLGLV